ncbi:P-loop containing nucleoside triphosphate hydrolase protein [Mycena olivaceomarginata]|nr:P-loop containing nucleoside triphosphate hydrolase protein [Mycena olivaceomarginata]
MEKLRSEDEDSPKLEDYSYTTLQFGIWRILLHRDSRSSISPFRGLSVWWKKLIEINSGLPIVWRFMMEIYALAPGLTLLLFILRLGNSVESTLMLYASSRLLRAVETGLAEGRPDVSAILQAVIIRVICIVFTATISWIRRRISPILRNRVTHHFEDYVFREQLRLDVPTSADKNNKLEVPASRAYYRFECLGGIFERGFQLMSQIIFTIRQPRGGITLTLLSLVSPFLASNLGSNIWSQAYVMYSDNSDYLRIRALRRFVSDKFREEVISADIMTWVLAQYQKARQGLGDMSDSIQDPSDFTPMTSILTLLSVDLPTFYWAASAIVRPVNFSITSFAILQQHAQGLRSTIGRLIYEFLQISDYVSDIRELYKIAEVENKIVDGEEPYPNGTLSTEMGMSFEFKNVSFAYPGAKSNDNAIKNISFKIPAGHLVVIVGANGSGKSTLIKLLNRLYDVDSGEILVDGLPIKNYRLADLRKAQALLAQDHALYPITLAENIGVGNPDRMNDMKMVMEAAESGGASEVIKKLTDGLQTTLDPVQTARGHRLDKYQHKKLKSILEELEKKAEVSGGEKQRLVAARTFMRFLSGNIRFAAADEPSSALDPKAEHQLFKHLRDAQQGKTLIFVTHRFGHLTKHADLVICMKDGEVVEAGTHKELMAHEGEYSELYNVQAQAFEI